MTTLKIFAETRRSFPVWIPLLLCIALGTRVSQSAHVLLMPLPYKSIVYEHSAIGSSLLERGHRVTILLSETYPELEKVREKSGFRVVTFRVSEPDFNSAESDDWMTCWLIKSPLDELRTDSGGSYGRNIYWDHCNFRSTSLHDGDWQDFLLWALDVSKKAFLSSCTNPFGDPDLSGKLAAEGLPDVAVVDGSMCQRCYWILCYRLHIPYISMSTIDEPWLRRLPALPSFSPFIYTGKMFTERMTFWERVENLAIQVDWSAWPRCEIVEDALVQRYLPEETYASLAARSLLWFIDRDVVLDYPRPVMPNEVSVGGLTTGPAKILPDGTLKKFVEMSTNKLVITSFGSYDIYGSRFFQQIFNAFRQFPGLNFVWRLSTDKPDEYSNEELWPKNILLSKWIPQNDLLGHNNTVLFITHCGANSQFEAVYHAVPMICIPGCADQTYNAARIHYHGYGVTLERVVHLETEKLTAAIREVVSNKSYADNIRRASNIYRSQPMTPRQRAVWWIEHVIENGAQHLHSYGLDMPWYEYLMLDIFGLFVLLPVVVMTSIVTSLICCWLLGKLRREDEDKKND